MCACTAYGTGDCFVIKFSPERPRLFQMMIDCGAWLGKAAGESDPNGTKNFTDYVTDLKKHVGSAVDVLVVTHEHKDHVLGFELCEELFQRISRWARRGCHGRRKTASPPWRGSKGHGAKKKALAAAAGLMARAVTDPAFHRDQNERHMGGQLLMAHQRFAAAVAGFVDLHMAADLAPTIGLPESVPSPQ